MFHVLGTLGLILMLPLDAIGTLAIFAYDSNVQVNQILGMDFTRTDVVVGTIMMFVITVVFALMRWLDNPWPANEFH